MATRTETFGDKPWNNSSFSKVPKGIPKGIPDDAVEEGGFYYWLADKRPPFVIMFAGGPGGHQEVHNSEYPDAIWDEMKKIDPRLK